MPRMFKKEMDYKLNKSALKRMDDDGNGKDKTVKLAETFRLAETGT